MLFVEYAQQSIEKSGCFRLQVWHWYQRVVSRDKGKRDLVLILSLCRCQSLPTID